MNNNITETETQENLVDASAREVNLQKQYVVWMEAGVTMIGRTRYDRPGKVEDICVMANSVAGVLTDNDGTKVHISPTDPRSERYEIITDMYPALFNKQLNTNSKVIYNFDLKNFTGPYSIIKDEKCPLISQYESIVSANYL